jgi:hypothetical protein
MVITAQFFKKALLQYPFKITKILTDKGAELLYSLLPENQKPKGKTHLFDHVCNEHAIEQRTTKARHSWTNNMIESLKIHFNNFMPYNFRQKMTFKSRITPFYATIASYRESDSLFIKSPYQISVGRNF